MKNLLIFASFLLFVFIFILLLNRAVVEDRKSYKLENYCNVKSNSQKLVCKYDCQKKGLEENCYVEK